MDVFWTAALIHFLAVASPGPDFFLVLRNSLRGSQTNGIRTSAGIMIGVMAHIGFCLSGLVLFIRESPLLLTILKGLAAAYLLHLAFQSFRSRCRNPNAHWISLNPSSAAEGGRTFREGLLCNLLNPKATLFFWSLFGALLESDTPAWLLFAIACEMTLMNFLWFAFVAWAAARPAFSPFYRKAERWIHPGFGLILGAFALLLLYELIA